MFCIRKEPIGSDPSMRWCFIQADVTPTVFPTTGEGVENLDFDFHIYPGSVIYCVDTKKKYFMNEQGTGWNCYGGE